MKKINVNQKSRKCLCGKTKDANGNCDGSHAQKTKVIQNISIALLALLMFFSFQSFSLLKKETMNVTNANIIWKGYKVTGSHEGTIALKSGNLIFDHNVLVGGVFNVDMSSLACTDLSGEYKNKLEEHLKSEDFFNTAKYPTSNLTFKKVNPTAKNSYNIEAEITIKGKKQMVSFSASVYGNKASAVLKIDRTKFDIKYGSGSFFDGLGDNLIYDEFDLILDINF